MVQETIIDFIRHGEPIGGSCYRGSSIDDALSEKGFEQMWAAVGDFDGWTRIVSSPLVRCKAFALQLAGHLGIPMQVEHDLREVGFGRWEGKTRQQLKQDSLAEYLAFYQDPVNARPEGAEGLTDFGARVAAVYEKILHLYSGEKILIVTHAGVIRAACGYVMQSPAANWYRLEIANAGLTRFSCSDEFSRMVCHNRNTMEGLV